MMGPSAGRPKRSTGSAATWLFGGTTLAVLCILALSCGHNPSQPLITPRQAPAPAGLTIDVRAVNRALTPEESAAYLGDAACAPCHRAIYDRQSVSRHARTLQTVSVRGYGNDFRRATAITDPLLGYTYSVAVENGRCVQIGRHAGGGGSLSADLVFGSGRNAHTFMSRIDGTRWVDLRLSYYTRLQHWDYTPMQKPEDRLWRRAAGIEERGAELINCLLCHVTTLQTTPTGIDTTNSHLGIGCERCHGPGRAHVETFHRIGSAGTPATAPAVVAIEDLRHAGQERINAICGACHRTPASAPPGDPKTENGLARFEGAALPRSACYQQSAALTCVTCHDPHGNADSSERRNDARCLACHARGATVPVSDRTTGPTALRLPGKRIKNCPVNPSSGCVRCHMPAQTIPTIPHATYHNHWIKVWPKFGGV